MNTKLTYSITEYIAGKKKQIMTFEASNPLIAQHRFDLFVMSYLLNRNPKDFELNKNVLRQMNQKSSMLKKIENAINASADLLYRAGQLPTSYEVTISDIRQLADYRGPGIYRLDIMKFPLVFRPVYLRWKHWHFTVPGTGIFFGLEILNKNHEREIINFTLSN